MGATFRLVTKVTGKSNPLGLKASERREDRSKNLVDPEPSRTIFELYDMMFGVVAANCLDAAVTVQKRRWLKILSVFIQRLGSRTPMDEDYDFTVEVEDKETGETKEVERTHKADKNFVRDCYLITCKGHSITTGEMRQGKSDLFKDFNSSKDINYIYKKLSETFKELTLGELMSVVIDNFNDHFADLEYGLYKEDSESKKITITSSTLYPHGKENQHSVQAPNGMLRITLAELNSMVVSTSTKDLSYRYRDQRTRKNLKPERIKQLMSMAEQMMKEKGAVLRIDRLDSI